MARAWGRMTRTRVLAWVAFALSLGVMVAGFLGYASAALPYPDPTPALLAHQAGQLRTGVALLVSGLLLLAVSAIGLWRSGSRSR